jgi:hypothetical protein
MAIDTHMDVRVIAAGGKFLGNDIGGAEVTVRDAVTGELVAHGRVRGDSGGNDIMGHPRTWGTPVPVQDSSVFRVKVPLDQPRLFDLSAFGPLGSLQSARRVTVQQWLAPGMDLTGELGVQIVIPGQLVEIISPATHDNLHAAGPVQIVANVAMMCGCPITRETPGQTAWWPEQRFDVVAYPYLVSGTVPVALEQVRLRWEATSRFALDWPLAAGYGYYEVFVVCRDRQNNNMGVDRATFFCVQSS